MADNLTLNFNGSLWNKWDLHVHTPASIENQYEGANDDEKWQRFMGDIEHLPPEFKVIGINDYFFIDGYRKVLQEWKDNGRMQNIALFLPVIEFRIRKFCGHKEWKRINFHVIFSNELTPDVIQQQFLSALTSKYKLDSKDNEAYWHGAITPESVADLGQKIIDNVPLSERSKYGSPLQEGFNNLNINDEDITKLLSESSYLRGKYITAIGKAEWDQLNWGDNSIAEKKDVINSVDIVFSASENINNFEKAKKKLVEAGVNDLLLDCSDSHHNLNSEDKDKLGNCNTWIKADTTFEGLKQILYEPEDRVCVSEVKPDVKESYQVISKVILSEEGFWQQELLLNPNLNTIIGGRSTGKSTLLSCIANQLSSYKQVNGIDDENKFVYQHTSGVTVIWADNERTSARKIDFYPQDYMYSIAVDKDKRNQLLESILLGQQNLSNIKSAYEEKINSAKRDLSELTNRLFELKDKGAQQRAKLKSLGDEKGMTNEIQQILKEMQALQQTLKLDKTLIDKYNLIQKQLGEADKNLEELSKEQLVLTKLLTVNYVSMIPELDMVSLSETNRKILSEFINNIILQANLSIRKKLEELDTQLKKQIGTLQKQKAGILNSQVYKESLEFQKKNQKYKTLQERLKTQNEKLANYKKEKAIIVEIGNKYKDTLNSIVESYSVFQDETQKVSNAFHIQHDGIIIKGLIEGDAGILRSRLEACMDQRSNSNKGLINRLCAVVTACSDSKDIIREFINHIMNGDIQLRANETYSMVISSILVENWYKISYSATYDGDDFDGMSRGKQAFVILKLLLDFSQNKCPILIDQPEDSLDNRAIFTDLVKYLKKKKKERQIILVTHNANVVVGADSELVIIANQNGNNTPNENGVKFQYLEGSLENTFVNADATSETPVLSRCGVREHVCDIVEGGKEAFVKREKKYGL